MANSSKPELLSPAGNFDKLKYALAYGADATYAGIPKFSLRTRENEFREDSLKKGIEYSHKMGKKIYLTLNIFAHNTKIDSFLKELDKVVAWNPDGLIMADPGLINIALKRYPDVPVHLSTQANATNWTTVQFWKDMGVERIILSRELRLKEIAEIKEKVPDIELESFVHGAICIAYSGRCLITNYMNHRDANQGTCTNSCRWEYQLGQEVDSLTEIESAENSKVNQNGYTSPEDGFFVKESHRPDEQYPISEDENGTYLFNAKDLCSVEILEDIKKAGVCSYKIEGRTKSEYYAAMCTRSYRKAIDDMVMGKAFDPQNLKDLLALSNRTYTTGFYTRNPKEFGENFTDGRSMEMTHKAAGMFLHFDESKGLLSFECKNRIEKGTTIEIITPDSVETRTITEIRNSSEKEVEVCHGGTGRFSIPLDYNPGEFAILRRPIYEAELANLLQQSV
ncbi:MAG: tRNA 5-hydroxyuridine modification protein YegQ [Candidatus Marinimicrobia bacterium]|nr:tRNA 5-hydroxyuridine modification protein YegQ [Candidatus Neomarinimicrobiota bacterium]